MRRWTCALKREVRTIPDSDPRVLFSHRLLWFAYYLDIHRRTACSGGMFSPCPAVPVSVPLSCGRVHNTRAPAEASNDCQRTLAFLPSLDLTVHPVTKTHWATRRRQPSLLAASCCATSQVMPMLLKFYCRLYIHLYSPERQQQQVKKAPNTQQKQTNKRERKKTTLKSGRLVNSVTTNEL